MIIPLFDRNIKIVQALPVFLIYQRILKPSDCTRFSFLCQFQERSPLMSLAAKEVEEKYFKGNLGRISERK